jgi:outer membrane protein assembly factor BamA
MLQLLLILLFVFPLSQQSKSDFYVERVEVDTEYDARYVRDVTVAIMPPDRLVSERDVTCVIDELKASGIFSSVEVKILLTKDKDIRRLFIAAKLHSQIESFVINDFVVNGISEVDEEKFRAKLIEYGLNKGDLFWKFPYGELKRKITKAINEAKSKNATQDDEIIPWIAIKADGVEKVRIVVSESYRNTIVCQKEGKQ